MLAGVETVRVLSRSRILSDSVENESFRGVGNDPLEAMGFADPMLQCMILKHAGNGHLLTVEGANCDLVLSIMERGFPFYRMESLNTPLSLSNSPVVRRDSASEAIAVLISDIDRPLLLRWVNAEGELMTILSNDGWTYRILEKWQRAVLDTRGDFENWLSTNFDHKRRKELKRLRNRLSEQGVLVTERLNEASDLKPFVNDFLRLESAGWKGARGTSLQDVKGMESALRDGLNLMHRNGKLRFWRMMLNGSAIATLFAIVDHGQATLGKIAYDETFGRYSPGQLIILDATEDFFADPLVQVADSNAIPDHPMIDRIWRDRKSIADVLIAPQGMSATRFNMSCAIEQVRRQSRAKAKSLYYSFKGGRPS
jgi:Acetyltransferase (GNAT) domain